MKVFQIGAAGGIGRRLAPLLVGGGVQVSGMYRPSLIAEDDPAERVASTGATPVLGDLIADSAGSLAGKLAGHDAVVFSAGAHGTGREQTALIDGQGLEKAAEAAIEAGVRRFVLVSVFMDAARGGQLGEGFEHYMAVKRAADVYLAATDLDWLIVRPGTLKDEPGDGRVRAGLAIPYGSVRRDNVAAFISAALATPALNRMIVELTDGSTPAPEAVTALVASRGKADQLSTRWRSHQSTPSHSDRAAVSVCKVT